MNDDKYLEVIYKPKLVGLVINSNVSWTDNVDYTIKRVKKTLWLLTRFRRLGVKGKKKMTHQFSYNF